MTMTDRPIRRALLMGALPLIAGLAASPAHAEAAHRAALVHDGERVTLTYTPRMETQLRDIAIGPRAAAACQWRARVAVDRQAVAADGQPIAALSRRLDVDYQRSGARAGACAKLTAPGAAPVLGQAQLRPLAAAVAAADEAALRADLAAIDAPGASARHVR